MQLNKESFNRQILFGDFRTNGFILWEDSGWQVTGDGWRVTGDGTGATKKEVWLKFGFCKKKVRLGEMRNAVLTLDIYANRKSVS